MVSWLSAWFGVQAGGRGGAAGGRRPAAGGRRTAWLSYQGHHHADRADGKPLWYRRWPWHGVTSCWPERHHMHEMYRSTDPEAR